MPVRFNHADLTSIARGYGGSPAAVERLCGSIRIESDGREFRLGLNLFASDYFLAKTRAELVTETIDLLTKYRAKCPKVCQWLGRGDFNPQKVPDRISTGELLHASRTGIRLRAAVLRRQNAPDPGQ